MSGTSAVIIIFNMILAIYKEGGPRLRRQLSGQQELEFPEVAPGHAYF